MSSSAPGGGQYGADLAGGIQDAGYVGEENQPFGGKSGGAGGGHLVRVDVVDAARRSPATQATTGRKPLIASRLRRLGRLRHAAHRAQRGVHLLGLRQEGVYPGKTHRQCAGGVQSGHQFVVDAAGKDLQKRIHHGGIGNPEAVDKTAFDAAFGQKAGHLLAAAVDHGDLGAG